MTSTIKAAVVIIAVIVIGLSGGVLAQTSRQPYLPLAKAEIGAAGEEVDRLLTELREFARTRKFTVREGNFPKQGRQVVNVGIYFGFGRDSFLSSTISSDRTALFSYRTPMTPR